MASDDFEYDEPTLPPLDPRDGLVCPRCRSKPSPETPTPPGTLPRCPRDGYAFVDARAIVASGGDPILGTTVAGRFTVIGQLGAGSMGHVYRARQEAVGRDVALKIVHAHRAYDPETKARFLREARATSALVSPHTVTVFDFGEAEDGSWFLAMELLRGQTLGERLRTVHRLPVIDAVRIAREALTSLSEAHKKGIVHRDLKPDNLFLTLPESGGAGEVCKVLDFGIAKLTHGEHQRVDQLETQAGTVFGTPRYMSPEQAQGIALDARSDLYSLGVILYQMLAGATPFMDDDAVVVMARHIKDDPPRFAEVAPDAAVPPAIEQVVRRALAKQPDGRQQSADQLIADLDQALVQSAVHATGLHSWVGPSGGLSGGAGRRRLAFAAGALGLVALAAGGFLLVRSMTPSASGSAQAPLSAAAPAAALAAPAASSATPAPASAPIADEPPVGEPDAGRRARRRGWSKPPSVAAPPPKGDDGYGRFE